MLVVAVVATNLRTADERAAVRGYAEEHGRIAGPVSEYARVRVAAILASLDWIEGASGASPLRELYVEATRAEVHAESVAAGDAQQAALRRSERATWPGVVHETLEWALGRGPEPI